MGWQLANAVDGSSPRVRGKRCGAASVAPRVRIIPARAGQTPARPPSPSLCPDHPRACGANNALPDNPMSMYGSSPRVRGKPDQRRDPVRRERIIPARAGQTCPRVRTRTRRPGSSPRVRGKRVCRSPLEEPYRIIPARAGQTRAWPYCPAKPSDHPSACGANEASDLAEAASDGSSPRVRGKPGGTCSPCQFPRIIPARAGQTRRGVRVSSTSPDHPRACGANSCSLSRLSSTSGSSPRVRGKPWRAVCLHGRYRIIPARAGQTSAG